MRNSRSLKNWHRIERPSSSGEKTDGFATLRALDEGNGLALGPASIVAVGFGEEGAVSAVQSFDISNVRIVQQLLTCFRQHANKGIIVRMHYEGGNGNAIHHPRGSGSGVVILSVVKARVARGKSRRLRMPRR